MAPSAAATAGRGLSERLASAHDTTEDGNDVPIDGDDEETDDDGVVSLRDRRPAMGEEGLLALTLRSRAYFNDLLTSLKATMAATQETHVAVDLRRLARDTAAAAGVDSSSGSSNIGAAAAASIATPTNATGDVSGGSTSSSDGSGVAELGGGPRGAASAVAIDAPPFDPAQARRYVAIVKGALRNIQSMTSALEAELRQAERGLGLTQAPLLAQRT